MKTMTPNAIGLLASLMIITSGAAESSSTNAAAQRPAHAAATLTPIPGVHELPGALKFHGRYEHRSRGRSFDIPGEVWVKELPDGSLNILTSLPFSRTSELIAADPQCQLISHQVQRYASDNYSGYRVCLKLTRDRCWLTRRGVREDCDERELAVPFDAVFDPNSRPDSYGTANVLLRAFAVDEGQTRQFQAYDWDNSGESFVAYSIEVRHAGKESITVPAGTFNANHLVLTQLSSANTWFKKRAGHVTDFWVLDNHTIVRVLRHREPYEIVLLDYTMAQMAPPQKDGPAPPTNLRIMTY